jgi:hypothetical protein
MNGCPARSTVLTPVDSDECISRDFIKGALFALAGVVIGVAIGTAIYFK